MPLLLIPAYPKVWTLGSKPTQHLLNHEVVIQEKIDGSCFSFGLLGGELRYRSHHREVFPGENEQWNLAIAASDARKHVLWPDWVYHGEFLAKPRHNHLKYGQIPRDHLIIFDVQGENRHFLRHDLVAAEAARLGFDAVPTLGVGCYAVVNIQGFLDTPSILGNTPVEGIVIKPLANDLYGPDGKPIFGKLVRPEFREAITAAQPEPTAILDQLAAEYAQLPRWRKALQHLHEQGCCAHEPKDIGPLIRLVQEDVKVEEEEAIKDRLFRWAWPKLSRRLTHGLPEWYKALLLEDMEAAGLADAERNGRSEAAERTREAAELT